ncbi:flagellar motor switch phosphatase FliY [Litchfieldia alkalitelluris]|uniref:flagellar motor switch phosphatase FliY n=1 Tax=Litchfieldia alkalitelluris TaxID=304268 RepID=UPI000996A3BD|nr:flagellar motor switch phosphatase FliY [Litchfieldia alkalitelluris]
MTEMLSQDEIDALLNGTNIEDPIDNNKGFAPPVDDYLSPMEQDALGEIGNISFGSSATALSTLLNQKVEITTPTVSVLEKSKLSDEFPHPYVAIHVSYTEGFSGANILVIKQSDAAIIADLMLGGNGIDPIALLGEIQLSAVQEAMNQMMGSAATSMSTIFSKKIDISPPGIDIFDIEKGEGITQLPSQEILTKISFRLKIGDLVDSNIMQLVPIEFAKDLVNELLNPGAKNNSKPSPVQEEQPVIKQEIEYAVPNSSRPAIQEEHYSASQPVVATQQSSYNSSPQHLGSTIGGHKEQVNVQPAAFSSFEPMKFQETESSNLDMLLDIPLQVTVELGRTKRSIKEILELTAGSIIELDKLAGEPVDVLVNSKLVAKGEVVVIDENFGVRITDIISQRERIKNLN